MSLMPTPIDPVPGGTARVAKAAFRKGNPLLKLRDDLGTIFADEDFADLFPKRGQPGLAPWRLALVTLLQFREDLSDRRAAEAVRARIDWEYLLGLELPQIENDQRPGGSEDFSFKKLLDGATFPILKIDVSPSF